MPSCCRLGLGGCSIPTIFSGAYSLIRNWSVGEFEDSRACTSPSPTSGTVTLLLVNSASAGLETPPLPHHKPRLKPAYPIPGCLSLNHAPHTLPGSIASASLPLSVSGSAFAQPTAPAPQVQLKRSSQTPQALTRRPLPGGGAAVSVHSRSLTVPALELAAGPALSCGRTVAVTGSLLATLSRAPTWIGSRGKQDISRALLGRLRVAELAVNRYTDRHSTGEPGGPPSILPCMYRKVNEGRCRKVKSATQTSDPQGLLWLVWECLPPQTHGLTYPE